MLWSWGWPSITPSRRLAARIGTMCPCIIPGSSGRRSVLRSGTANVPLHTAHAPRWLFERLVRLSAKIAGWIAVEQGTAELFRRLSDPLWFQAFGAVIGMDWHSSGVTAIVCGALKQGLQHRREELGLVVAGGEGAP